MKTKEIKERIQQLISQAVIDNENQKKRLNYLFGKLDEIKEVETMERLSKFENGKYLNAYLLYKSIMRANYQTEHLNLTNFADTSKYLDLISKDIELLEEKEKNLLEKKPKCERCGYDTPVGTKICPSCWLEEKEKKNV